MTTIEKIIAKLSEAFPQKTFAPMVRIDPISFQPWTMITCNGKETPYGIFEHIVPEEQSDAFTEQWVLINQSRFTHF